MPLPSGTRAGRLARVRRGRLVRWRGPERLVDTTQLAVTAVAHQVQLLAALLLEDGLTGVETGGEHLLHVWRPAPHRDRTVFIRLSMERCIGRTSYGSSSTGRPWSSARPACFLNARTRSWRTGIARRCPSGPNQTATPANRCSS